MIALVCGGTLNSSAANLRTAVKGAPSGTLNLNQAKFNQIQQNSTNEQTKTLGIETAIDY